MKAKVLVVEDSAPERDHIVELLRDRGYTVVEAAGAFEALSVASRERPDVVLLDLVLGELDGLGVCRMLRASDMGSDVAIVMLTVKGGVMHRVEGLHLGADDYLPKPFDPHELDARISAAHRARAGRRELRRQIAELTGKLAETEQVATKDALTSLANRRRFMDVLRTEWTRGNGHRHPLSCALVNLDRFKQVNDVFGNATGDDALRRVAALIHLSTRNIDLAARFGGDEFALLLPNTSMARSRVVLERIRARLHAERAYWGASGGVTLSIGVASSEDDTIQSPDDLMRAADRALYEAKRDGRDRIATAGPFERGTPATM